MLLSRDFSRLLQMVSLLAGDKEYFSHNVKFNRVMHAFMNLRAQTSLLVVTNISQDVLKVMLHETIRNDDF